MMDNILELLNNSAFMSIISLLIGSFLTWFFQKAQRNFDYKKLIEQQRYQESLNWKNRFIIVVSDLLVVLSPTYTSNDKNEVLRLVHKTEILLNPSIESHKKILDLLIPLALDMTKETNNYTFDGLLDLYIELTDAVRDIVAYKK